MRFIWKKNTLHRTLSVQGVLRGGVSTVAQEFVSVKPGFPGRAQTMRTVPGKEERKGERRGKGLEGFLGHNISHEGGPGGQTHWEHQLCSKSPASPASAFRKLVVLFVYVTSSFECNKTQKKEKRRKIVLEPVILSSRSRFRSCQVYQDHS